MRTIATNAFMEPTHVSNSFNVPTIKIYFIRALYQDHLVLMQVKYSKYLPWHNASTGGPVTSVETAEKNLK